ncbi:MAG: HlyC/CorC family transporter [Clostridia bacterium]|nr:HlyC/CorC family transporter [Clostridia bacterium]
MSTLEIIFLVVVLVCILLSGYFSATETAFTAINKIRLRAKAEDGDKGAKRVLKLADNYDRLLTTILIGNNIVNILASSLFTLLMIALIPKNEGLATTLSTVILTVVILIFGEITPKVLAKEFPEGFARFSAPFINVLAWLLIPFTFLFGLWKKLLLKIFKHKEDNAITDDELKILVEEAEHEGGINAQESDLIRSAIEFNDLEAKDILVPRVDVIAIDCQTPLTEVDKIFMETRYSRLPVYKDTVDNIIGILHEKDFIKQRLDENFSLEKASKPAIFVVSTTKISAVLQQLQKSKSHMAVVSGEFGDTVGIITMEDILEELVGEIWDEHDEVLSDITQESETEYKVLGSTSVNDLCAYFDLGNVESDSATVGGWVIDMLGKVPDEGDELVYQNLQLTVAKTEFRRITELKVVILSETEENRDDDNKRSQNREE